MLFKNSVSPSILVLLKKLMEIEEFKELRLVGGTALALRLGHRKSVDIDLFGAVNFENIPVDKMFSGFVNHETISRSKYINSFYLENIKVDFVNYYYPWLEDVHREDGIRFAGFRDIAAMKLAAITNRGSRKDFIDLYFLSKMFSFEEMVKLYQKKYTNDSLYMVFKSLSWFGDAEKDQKVEMIQDVPWETVKDTIRKGVINYQSTH